MDGTKKRVTFDDEDGKPEQDEPLPPVETEENGDVEQQENGEEGEEEEEEETVTNGDLIEEFDESMSKKIFVINLLMLFFSFLVPSTLDKLQKRLQEDKSTLNIIWKRINNNRLPAIPKIVLNVNKKTSIIFFRISLFFRFRTISMFYLIIMNLKHQMNMY